MVYLDNKASLAQRTEQESSKFLVAGSTPAGGALDNTISDGKIEYMYKYDDERDEKIRKIKRNEPKPKKPKSNHKHEYEEKATENNQFWGARTLTQMVCRICGRIK